jgi:hypothetical protein
MYIRGTSNTHLWLISFVQMDIFRKVMLPAHLRSVRGSIWNLLYCVHQLLAPRIQRTYFGTRSYVGPSSTARNIILPSELCLRGAPVGPRSRIPGTDTWNFFALRERLIYHHGQLDLLSLRGSFITMDQWFEFSPRKGVKR